MRLRAVSKSRRFASLIGFLLSASFVFAEEPKWHVLWATVSPDGKYALAWSTTDPDARPDPDDIDNEISNAVIEIATSQKVADLSDLRFWQLKDDHPEQWWLDTVWSDDSRYLLVLLNRHWTHVTTTMMVLLADTVNRRGLDLSDRISKLISAKVTKDYDGSYFENPWFVGTDRFSLIGDAKDRTYAFYFQFANSPLALAKAVPATSQEETPDRALNRVYRTLHGLLSPDQQKALVEEERAWLVKRDAIKSGTKRDEFINERSKELQERLDKIIQEKPE
jgi:hypothetical protein